MTTDTHIVAFSGHRPPKLGLSWAGDEQRDLDVIADMADMLVRLKATSVITGMALGIDQLAARAAIRRGIPFDAYIPFPGQESRWPLVRRDAYHQLLDQARSVWYISKTYSAAAFQKRNVHMVDDADVLLAYFDGSPGGTKNCIDYAVSIGQEVIKRVGLRQT